MQLPWKKLPSGEASNNTAGAISSTSANLLRGMAFFKVSRSSSARGVNKSVFVTPGATALTNIPVPADSRAKALVNVVFAPLAAQ